MQKAKPAVPPSDTITIHLPIAFRRQGGRKTVTTANDSPARPRGNSAVVKAIARAFRWRKLIQTGIFATVAEIAVAEKINDSYVARVLRLTLLAPEIVEAILDGRNEPRLGLPRLLAPLPLNWEEQRSSLRP